ncbi:MAG: VOC family protein [Deltaproteobacteria bacterium]|nr:MAG: VOC family protein [Deltaproteobacteria bacterium]
MAKAKSYIPEGLRTVTAHLVVPNALDAIEFYKKAFGAEVTSHHPGPAPRSTMHATIRIGDTALMLADEMPQSTAKSPGTAKTTTVSLSVFVPDVDAVFNKAVAAGAKVTMPLGDQFWGDRYGQVTDPFGHLWELATHKEDLTPQELGQRAAAFFQQMAAQGPPK